MVQQTELSKYFEYTMHWIFLLLNLVIAKYFGFILHFEIATNANLNKIYA